MQLFTAYASYVMHRNYGHSSGPQCHTSLKPYTAEYKQGWALVGPACTVCTGFVGNQYPASEQCTDRGEDEITASPGWWGALPEPPPPLEMLRRRHVSTRFGRATYIRRAKTYQHNYSMLCWLIPYIFQRQFLGGRLTLQR